MIRFFAAHPTAANLLMVALLLMGVLTLPSLQRATFPDFTTTTVEVQVPYPGATAADVEESICRRIENAVDGVENVKEIRSEARDGIGVVTLEMAEGGDATTFLTDVKTDVEAIKEFPDQAEDPVIRPVMRTDKVVSIAISGDMTARDLKSYAEEVRERLQRVPDVSLVELSGFGQRQIRIEVPASTLMQYAISADDLARIVGSQSVDLPAGTLQTPDRDLVLRFTDERRTPAEFEDLVVVGGTEGGEIRLGEIARISDVFEPEEEKVLFNGKRAAILAVEKTKQEDTLTVFQAVQEFVEDEQARRPTGITLALTQDMASVVRDRLDLLVTNGWQGLLLILGVMWIFFGFRYSFWVAAGLPVAFLGAFFVMPHIGMTINMLTMVALLMALGLLMDDAIVLAENIAKEREHGKSPLEATIDGVRGVSVGVVSAFLTTLAVFTPLAFIEGDIGTVLRVVPITLILVLAVSLIEAFLILPHHLAHAIGKQAKEPGRARRAIDRAVVWFRERVLGPVVDTAVSWRYLTAGLVISAFLVSIGLLASGRVKFQAFPELDGDVAMARLLMPAGTPLARTEREIRRITDALDAVNAEFQPRQPGKKPLIRNVVVQFNVNQDAKERGPHVATIVADLLPAEHRHARVDDVLNRWRDIVGPVPDAIAMAFTQGVFGPAGRAIEIRIQGDDLAKLDRAGHQAVEYLERYEGVENLMTDLRPGKPEALIRMRPGARGMGLTAATVATQLRAAFYGATAGEIQVGREDFEVDVRLAARDRERMGALDGFRVTLADGRQVPLGSVATVDMDRGYARVARVDRQRTVTITGDVDTERANTNEILALFREEAVPAIETSGVRVNFEGEIQEGQKTQLSMVRALLIGLVGVFVLLSFQFRSYLEPITVMMAIPFALIGVLWGHKLLGLPFTMPSMLGFASLAGIVVNDSILLVEFIKRRRREGMPVDEAVRGASRDRFRAIMLTSLTTVMGLMPLLSETSMQAQILIPLAASIVFGLFASTVLVLIVIPSLYAILGDLGWVTKEP